MATSVPLSFKPQVPVTPPPDQHLFRGPFHPQPSRPDFIRAAYEATGMKPPQIPVPPSVAHTSSTSTKVPGAPELPDGPNDTNNNVRDPTADRRYIAMASRIASYYQQRCQAVANFQQQRCQVWANAQRAKCQEMMQAAMLIVAWYIRDRISRRRRRERRAFKRGLKQRCKANSKNKITKGESVRRWVMGVPLGATASPRTEANEKRTLDKEEESFEMDKEDQTPDKDSQLFNVADSMIKSQLARIDVPLLGVLSFDESDDETESETEADIEEEAEDFEQEEDEEMDEEYDDDDGDSEEDESRDPTVEAAGSKSAHLGTSTKDSSGKRTKSSCVS